MEAESFEPLPVGGEHYDPFEIEAINRDLNPWGLAYGGGYGRFRKPHFFLGELLRLRSEVTRLRADLQETAQSKVAISGKGNVRQNNATDDEAARLLSERDEASVKAEAAVKKMWEAGKGGREDALGFARKLRDEQAASGSKLEAYKRYAATAREIEEKTQKEVEVGARSPLEADIAHFERLQAEVDLARITGRLPAQEK